MHSRTFAIGFCLLLLITTFATPARAVCRIVSPIDAVAIKEADLRSLNVLGFDRKSVFAALAMTSQFETSGCWGGTSGDFDDQIVSAGALQWNFEKGSLQRALQRYKPSLGSKFDSELNRLMPTSAGVFFSSDCLNPAKKDSCRSMIYGDKRHQDLAPLWAEELDSLFNTDEMIQIGENLFPKVWLMNRPSY